MGAERSRSKAERSCSGVDHSKTGAEHSYSGANHSRSGDEWSRSSAEHCSQLPSTPGAVPTTLAEQGTPSIPIEFTSPPSNIIEFMDAFHDGEKVRFHWLDDIVGSTGSSGLVGP